ncbi:MAG TPA: double zinc ribbon domain-containing protein [bacterium]|nr:double zinc ribbon domain-containing protein [bacterium]
MISSTTWTARLPASVADALAPLLPRRCPICGATLHERARVWCVACEAGMRVYTRPVCGECRRFLDPGSDCPAGHVPLDPARISALGAFDGAFGALVHALKYDGFRELARPLGDLLAERFAGSTPDVVVPVPTAPRKRRKRGFGHAEEIARACALRLGVACLPDALRFTRRVADQTRLNALQRQANMREALTAREGVTLTGKSLLVVDDVFTTGAMMRESARALKAAGAGAIQGAVVALNLNAQR